MRSIQKLLIANRGEIACRIIRTTQRLGIKAIAIYADPDKDALHCQLADEAYYVGPIPIEESYNNMQAILEVAKKCNAEAIHPGYGFLSENAQFAELCEKNHLLFIGPLAQAIALMAVKDVAKQIMSDANIPTIPGTTDTNYSDSALEAAATQIGFPLLLKAAKGGGGKGMRIVHQPEDLGEAIASARRESLSSFGDASLFIEKYLNNARHIEVQIFRDTAGNTVHLFERDCSLQRRHQKIIEECPAMGLTPEVKQKLYQAAIDCANAIEYIGAGTVEFLYTSDAQFYFMEMNTRLQVEHPITEMITGIDLVEWQIRIARGETLPLKQEQITCQGHAIEARIYAEDPFHDFLPATGVIQQILLPTSGDYRLESGIQVGDKISIYFDPLLAKMIVYAASREEAIHSLQHILHQYQIMGLNTNLPFLRNIAKDPAFYGGTTHTHYVTSHLGTLLPTMADYSNDSIAIACLVYLLHRQWQAKNKGSDTSHTPWQQTRAWRLNCPFEEYIYLAFQQHVLPIRIHHLYQEPFALHLLCTERSLNTFIDGKLIDHKIRYYFPSHQGSADFNIHDGLIEIFSDGKTTIFKLHQQVLCDTALQATHARQLLSPMPGVITKIGVSPGEHVTQGTPLLCLEAMKMEHTLRAPQDGIIKSIYYAVGDQVENSCQLIDFE